MKLSDIKSIYINNLVKPLISSTNRSKNDYNQAWVHRSRGVNSENFQIRGGILIEFDKKIFAKSQNISKKNFQIKILIISKLQPKFH